LTAGANRLRGFRYLANWDASPAIMGAASGPHILADYKFRKGFAYLNKYNLEFDTWLFHPQIPDCVSLARAFPETTIVMNHVGGPVGVGPYAGRRKEIFEEWKKGIDDLASCPNVMIKLGGLGMTLNGFGWHERPAPPGSEELANTIAPYINYCIDRFGVGRCMFESNFPVDRVSYSYTVIWNAFKRITKSFSASERAALFHDSAMRIYRLREYKPKKDNGVVISTKWN
jgi:L-fuconolactonase